MSKEIQIPVEVVSFADDGYHIFTKGKLKGRPLRLLIDTGASKTVLDKKFLGENFPHLPLEMNDMPATGAGTNTIQTEITEVSDFFSAMAKRKTLHRRLINFRLRLWISVM